MPSPKYSRCNAAHLGTTDGSSCVLVQLGNGRSAGTCSSAFCSKFFKCKTVLEREFSVFFKEIALLWTEKSDLSFLFCCWLCFVLVHYSIEADGN